MIFSKSFGYAVRGVLYIAAVQEEKRYVQVEEIASNLSVPKYFMGKILKKLAKQDVLISIKGPAGGFALNEKTLVLPLMLIMEITDGMLLFRSCALRIRECNAQNPCPLHCKMDEIKGRLRSLLLHTTIGKLLSEDRTDFIRSISSSTLEIPIITADKIAG